MLSWQVVAMNNMQRANSLELSVAQKAMSCQLSLCLQILQISNI